MTDRTDLAAALLKDVPRMKRHLRGPNFLPEDAVLAALTAALDPAIAEQAGEVLEATLIADGLEALDWSNTPIGHKVLLRGAVAALRGVPALLAQNAALRAERDALAAEVKQADTMLVAEANASLERLARAEAAEAKVEKLRGALQIARVHVANNAEGWSVSRGAARDDLTIVDAALTTEEGK